MTNDELNFIDQYDYILPQEKIAEYPLEERAHSKLLVYKNTSITDARFDQLVDYLPPSSILYFNTTKVVQARLLFFNSSGAKIELFCLEPCNSSNELVSAMNIQQSVDWKCFIGNAKRWKSDKLLSTKILADGEKLELIAQKITDQKDYSEIHFSWTPSSITFSEVLENFGDLPLPPYIKRATETSDKERYQTVYAKQEGSVAAPTAGLHFTDAVLNSLSNNGVQQRQITLHVGAGTFKPVKTSSILDHDMHAEFIFANKETLEQLAGSEQEFSVAVGTTSMRTLESLYWLGCKLIEQKNSFDHEFPFLKQWEAYQQKTYTVKESIEAILRYMSKQGTISFSARTALLIKPGYQFKICKAIITNFHQPKSTLLCLVAAAIELDELKKVYAHALSNQYRFLSYGDSSLLYIKNT